MMKLYLPLCFAVLVVGSSGGINAVRAAEKEQTVNFLVAFEGVSAKSKCAVDWRLKVIVKDGADGAKTFENVPVELVTSNDKKNIYKGSVVLEREVKDKMALFIKGPKHIQVKYGKDYQRQMYTLAGGELRVSSKAFDFSNYELGVGDVNIDGVVNAKDFVTVKNRAVNNEVLDEGENVAEDLDGNCIVNANDVSMLKGTLNEKQDQIY